MDIEGNYLFVTIVTGVLGILIILVQRVFYKSKTSNEAIHQFEIGFYLFDSLAENDILTLAMSKHQPSLVYIFAAMVKLWQRNETGFKEASEIIRRLERRTIEFSFKEKVHFKAIQFFQKKDYIPIIEIYGGYLQNHEDTVALRMLMLVNFLGGFPDKIFRVYDNVKDQYWHCPTFISYYCLYGSFSDLLSPTEFELYMTEASRLAPDRWTVHHVMCHVMKRKPLNELVDYIMNDASKKWGPNVGQGYRSHGFFHAALIYIFMNEAEKANGLFNSEIWPENHPCRSSLLVQMNAIGFLWMLDIADPNAVSLSDWQNVARNVIKEKQHLSNISIMGLIMALYCLHRSGMKELAMKSVSFMDKCSADKKVTMKGRALLEGCLLFCEGRYAEACQLLGPHASDEDSRCIGASDEQRLPLWFTYIASLSRNPAVSSQKLRAVIMKQVNFEEREIWPIELKIIKEIYFVA